MATTTPDNIQYPVNSDQVAPLASHFKNVADSTQAALNNKASNADVALKVDKAGDTMTGALVLPGNPTTNLQAAPKQYVDTADALKVAKAGDTMTGALVLSGDPTLALHAATKQYVDTADAALQTQITSNLQTSRVYVKNGATALTKGTPVYITGADGTNIIVGAASNASEATSSKVIGLLETDLAINGMGYAVTEGKLANIDTSAAGAAGDAVWLGPNGTKVYGLANKPVAPAHMVYLGVVAKKNGSTGEIQVHIQNGFELNELHDVLIVNPQNKQVVAYEDGLWKNKQATGGVTVGATAPTGPNAGDAWYNSNNGMLYVWYVDADSTAQWVQVKANSGLEASILSRLGALESTTVAFGNLSPNYVLNSGFDINQRNLNSTGVQADGYVYMYGFDRWATQGAYQTIMYSSQAFTPGAAPVAGYEGTNYARLIVSGSSTDAGIIARLNQRIEDVRTLAGKTITLSFWAKSSAAGKKITGHISQNFGSGGSGAVETVVSQFSTTTGWARYSATVTLPSVSGKTIGAGSFLEICFWVSCGSTFNSYTNSMGIQTGTFDIWGVQIEVGTTATAFRRNQPNIQAELAACQRYYYRLTAYGAGYVMVHGSSVSATQAEFNIFKDMRIGPTSVETSNVAIYRLAGIGVAGSTYTLYAPTQTNTIVRFTGGPGSFTSPTPENVIIYASSAGGYIALNAEL